MVTKSFSKRGTLVLTHNLPSDAQLRNLFDAVPLFEKHKVAEQTVRAGIRPIVTQAKALTPWGTEKDRRRRSKGQRRKADWETHLRTKITSVVRRGSARNRGGAVGVAGAKWEGQSLGGQQKMYLIADWKKNTRIRKFWGYDPPPPWSTVARKRRNIMIDAANFSRPDQLTAMKRKLQVILRSLWMRGIR